MKLLPIALNVAGKNCLVVGGGPVALRKVKSLFACGARVTVVSSQLCSGFDLYKRPEYVMRVFTVDDCDGRDLIIACTDARHVNAAILQAAQARNIWCNVADDAAGSDFHTAAAVRRGDVCIGITTGGASPALARHLKDRIAETLGPEYEALLEILAARRQALGDELGSQGERAEVWRAILEGGDILALLKDGKRDAAERLLDGIIARSR